MSVHVRIDGAWDQADRLFTHYGGSWAPVKEAWVKRAGVWVKAYELDIVPPSAPLIALSIETTKYGPNNKNIGRHIRVSVQVPGANDPNIALVRILTTYQGKQPTTQFGGTYTSAGDQRFPNEPWSEWRYGSGQSHPNTASPVFKTWPRSAPPSSQLVDNQVYHFSGWTQDRNGNWSVATHASIKAPKKGTSDFDHVDKEAKFSTIWTGTRADGFTVGQMTQQGSPLRRGVMGYGNAVQEEVGLAGLATLKSAQVKLSRTNDSGTASANIYIAYHSHLNYAATTGWPSFADHRKLGTLAKGETKWFDLPAVFWPTIEASGSLGVFRGFVFLEKAPNTAAGAVGDYSILKSNAEDPTQGLLHLTWSEALT